MTDQEHLERPYRRLLAWYPRSFRREHGEEILAVLLACAPAGRRRPGLAQAADLIRGGLWMRLRPGVPRSAPTVRAAVRLMCAGAAVSTVNLIILLAFIGDITAYHAMLGHPVLGHRLTELPLPLPAAVVSTLNTLIITQAIVTCLVPVALWLWMARASGQGRDWARILSTVLVGLATLQLIGLARMQLTSVYPQWEVQAGLWPTVFSPIFPVLTWLVGLAAVCLLWLPASSAYFRSPGYRQARRQAQMAELARIRPSRARWPRQV